MSTQKNEQLRRQLRCTQLARNDSPLTFLRKGEMLQTERGGFKIAGLNTRVCPKCGGNY